MFQKKRPNQQVMLDLLLEMLSGQGKDERGGKPVAGWWPQGFAWGPQGLRGDGSGSQTPVPIRRCVQAGTPPAGEISLGAW